MYAQRLDLKDDTEVGKGTCAVNIFQLRMVQGTKELYMAWQAPKGVVDWEYHDSQPNMCIWKQDLRGELIDENVLSFTQRISSKVMIMPV